MFEKITISIFFILFVSLTGHFLITTFLMRNPQISKPMTRIQIFLVSFFIVITLLFLTVFVTGFFMPLVHSDHITGFWMLIHIPASAFFTAMFILLILLTANNNTLRINQIPILKKLSTSQCRKAESNFLVRICFWAMTAIFIPLIFSIILSMFKIFGTKWQLLFRDIHKYSAVAFTVFFGIVLYSLMKNTRKMEIWNHENKKNT